MGNVATRADRQLPGLGAKEINGRKWARCRLTGHGPSADWQLATKKGPEAVRRLLEAIADDSRQRSRSLESALFAPRRSVAVRSSVPSPTLISRSCSAVGVMRKIVGRSWASPCCLMRIAFLRALAEAYGVTVKPYSCPPLKIVLMVSLLPVTQLQDSVFARRRSGWRKGCVLEAVSIWFEIEMQHTSGAERQR